jgi:uncharacterized protein (DUF488 family)
MTRRVYTLGYDGRPWDEFVKILKTHMINKVIDVRRFPTSKFYIYKKELLSRLLNLYSIEYYWLGEYLGGFRGGYLEYMRTKNYWRGIDELLKIIKCDNNYSVIICRERIPWRCHRRFISSTLLQLGYEVIHIIDYGIYAVHKKIYK